MNIKTLQVVNFHGFCSVSVDHGSFTHICLALVNLIVLLESVTSGYGTATPLIVPPQLVRPDYPQCHRLSP